MMAKKLFLLLIILLVSTSYLFSLDLALGAEAQYSPALLTIGDSSSFLSEGSISLFTSLCSRPICYSLSVGIEKGIEHYSFHRFSKLTETASLIIASSIGYLINKTSTINLGFGFKLSSIGSLPYNTRVLSPLLRLIYRREYKGEGNAPDFFFFLPLEVLYGKTAKGIAMGIGLGYSFSSEEKDGK